MTPNCRPGDLAVVVRATIPENIGRIVRVVSSYPGQQNVRMHCSTSCIWLIAAADPLTWSTDGRTYRSKQGPAPDEALQPIRGPGDENAEAGGCREALYRT
jgi:hypothetical protein